MSGNKWKDVFKLRYNKTKIGRGTMDSMQDYGLDFGPDEHIWEAVGINDIVTSMRPVFAGFTHVQR